MRRRTSLQGPYKPTCAARARSTAAQTLTIVFSGPRTLRNSSCNRSRGYSRRCERRADTCYQARSSDSAARRASSAPSMSASDVHPSHQTAHRATIPRYSRSPSSFQSERAAHSNRSSAPGTRALNGLHQAPVPNARLRCARQHEQVLEAQSRGSRKASRTSEEQRRRPAVLAVAFPASNARRRGRSPNSSRARLFRIERGGSSRSCS